MAKKKAIDRTWIANMAYTKLDKKILEKQKTIQKKAAAERKAYVKKMDNIAKKREQQLDKIIKLLQRILKK